MEGTAGYIPSELRKEETSFGDRAKGLLKKFIQKHRGLPSIVDTPREEIPVSQISTEPATQETISEELKLHIEKLISEKDVSLTTRKYLENWTDSTIEGNQGIEKRIMENIIRAEERNREEYESFARAMKISVDELKDRLQELAERTVVNSRLFRATDISVLEKVLIEDGRYKSQFEVNKSGGSLNPKGRAKAEIYMFGFNQPPEFDGIDEYYDITEEIKEDNKLNRPIYGYFSDAPNGEINREGKNPPLNKTVQYGKISVKLKEEVRIRTTITFQDSLGGYRYFPPTPALRPHFTSIDINDYDYSGKKIFDISTSKMSSYTEAQFHCQLRASDIESIHVSEGNNVYDDDAKLAQELVKKYNDMHPDSPIEFINY